MDWIEVTQDSVQGRAMCEHDNDIYSSLIATIFLNSFTN